MSFKVSFPGGVGVDVSIKGHSVHTDQPAPLGSDTAMSPSDLFFASIAGCAGYYALRFCQERGLSTDGLAVKLDPVRDAEGKRVVTIHMELQTPEGFPEKYRQAILRAVDHCAVKRMILEPPRFEIELADRVEQPA